VARLNDEEKALSRLGYAQELLRSMGGFSSFALSFSIISVLTGIFSTYTQGLKSGGPAALGLGWPLVAIGTMLVALAMAELASAFPTAGALYHWSALLGGPGAGWITAMMNLVGQIAIVGAIDLACAQTAIATFGLPMKTPYVLFAIVIATHALLNVISIRLVAWLNDFSATVHIVGVVVLVAALFALGRAQPIGFLAHTGFTTRADGVWPLGFVQALVVGMWTFTGFDASAHASEETHDPARRAPRGIIAAVVISAIAGYAVIVALTLAIRDLPASVAQGGVELLVLEQSLGARAATATMTLVVAAMWFCGLSSVTSASRTLYAFARDGGFPGSAYVRLVHPRLRTPHVAIALAAIAPLALVLSTAPLREEIFLSIATLATTGLYVSYAIPIALGAIARSRGRWRHRGPWHLGRFGVPIAWAGVAWAACVLGVSALADALSAKMLGGIVVAFAALWLLRVRGRFRGPAVDLAIFERAAAPVE
jgi:amino acid transporter